MTQESGFKRLFRSEDDRIIAGVCGGVGQYFGIDPVLVRIAWIISVFMSGIGIFIYILAWFLIPRQPMEMS